MEKGCCELGVMKIGIVEATILLLYRYHNIHTISPSHKLQRHKLIDNICQIDTYLLPSPLPCLSSLQLNFKFLFLRP